MDIDDKKPKPFQVKSNWFVFRIINADMEEVNDWCEQFLVGPYKILQVVDGYSRTFYPEGKREKTMTTLRYDDLVEVDILYEKDAIRFKLEWF